MELANGKLYGWRIWLNLNSWGWLWHVASTEERARERLKAKLQKMVDGEDTFGLSFVGSYSEFTEADLHDAREVLDHPPHRVLDKLPTSLFFSCLNG